MQSGIGQVNDGAVALRTGAASAADGADSLAAGAGQVNDGATALQAGIGRVNDGATALQAGIGQVNDGAVALQAGIGQVNDGAAALHTGAATLDSGAATLKDGADTLASGTTELVSNNGKLSEGVDTLDQGASDLDSGAQELLNGAKELKDGTIELKDGLPELTDGTTELKDALQSGSDDVKSTNLTDGNSQMYANPVDAVENQISTVKDNGHAMAAYMMSVGLWVACLAFCLMYPLTEHGTLKSGFSWWLSKASVLYPVAIIQGIVLVVILHVALGFSPARMGETIAMSCLTSVAFMAIMYFFNVLLGKVGSFLMLVFMVLQLAGSAGTYPIEVSGPLAAALHDYVPFTYSVTAFRSAIGGGAPYGICIAVLTGILVVFSVLTVVLFMVRGKKEQAGKGDLHSWMEAHGLA